MADGIDAAIYAVQPTRFSPPLHRMAPISERVQLPHGDHAVLPRREVGETCVI